MHLVRCRGSSNAARSSIPGPTWVPSLTSAPRTASRSSAMRRSAVQTSADHCDHLCIYGLSASVTRAFSRHVHAYSIRLFCCRKGLPGETYVFFVLPACLCNWYVCGTLGRLNVRYQNSLVLPLAMALSPSCWPYP